MKIIVYFRIDIRPTVFAFVLTHTCSHSYKGKN